jgi:hypothetical protein
MTALSKALDKIEAKAKKVASHMLEAAENDILFKDGKFTVAGTDKSAAWGEVALNAYIAHKFSGADLEPGLKESAFHDPTNFTFPAGCHVCEVEIDPETGLASIANWVAVDDFGVVVNPMIVEGQVHGGVAQGIGQALLEGAVYDGDAQLVTGSLMDYTMPRADDLPSFTVDTTVTRCPSNPLGIKGCGEAGAIAAPAAVMNAITDAIGSEDVAMPATPQAVWMAIRKAQSRKAASVCTEGECESVNLFHLSPHGPHPEERALARVSKDGSESVPCIHPSRRIAYAMLLRMRLCLLAGLCRVQDARRLGCTVSPITARAGCARRPTCSANSRSRSCSPAGRACCR